MRLAGANAAITVLDIDPDRAEAVARVGGEALVLDLADLDAVTELALDVDILVNNAGLRHVSPIHEFPPEQYSLILRVMLGLRSG